MNFVSRLPFVYAAKMYPPYTFTSAARPSFKNLRDNFDALVAELLRGTCKSGLCFCDLYSISEC